MRTIPRVAVATVGVVIAGLLAGCGVADEGVRPGVAAEVGDAQIELADVEQAAKDRCKILDELAGEGGQPQSGAVVRGYALQGAVLRELADQLAAEYDVEPSERYESFRSQVRDQLGSLDEDLVDRVLDNVSGGAYFEDILVQVGREQLGLRESEDPDGQQGFARGIEIAQDWVAEHPIETNPRFTTLSLGDDRIVTGRSDLSTPVSDFARSALAAGEDPQAEGAGYAASLPDSQRCG